MSTWHREQDVRHKKPVGRAGVERFAYTRDEVAQALAISVSQVDKEIVRGELCSLKIRGSVRIEARELQRYIAQRRSRRA